MREHGIGQFTVDAHRPVAAFDLGVSFATELGYTNMLTALDLAGIPLDAVDRGEDHPVVIAGGTRRSTRNRSPFVDAAVLGDGEQAVLAITEIVREWKRASRPGGRDGLLVRLAADGGVYVPKFYDVSYLPDGRIQRVVPNRPGVPWQVRKHTVMDLDSLAVSAQTTGSARGDRARTIQRRDLPWLHARLPVLSGRDDHPTGPGTDHDDRRHGQDRPRALWIRRGGPAVAVQCRPLRDRHWARRPVRREQRFTLSPSTRVDAFNVALANELSRSGRRSG